MTSALGGEGREGDKRLEPTPIGKKNVKMNHKKNALGNRGALNWLSAGFWFRPPFRKIMGTEDTHRPEKGYKKKH